MFLFYYICFTFFSHDGVMPTVCDLLYDTFRIWTLIPACLAWATSTTTFGMYWDVFSCNATSLYRQKKHVFFLSIFGKVKGRTSLQNVCFSYSHTCKWSGVHILLSSSQNRSECYLLFIVSSTDCGNIFPLTSITEIVIWVY